MGNTLIYLQEYHIKENMTVIYGLPIAESKLGKVYFEGENGDKIYKADKFFYLSIQDGRYIVRHSRTKFHSQYYIVLKQEGIATAISQIYIDHEEPASLINMERSYYLRKWKPKTVTGQVNVQNHYLRYK